MGIRSGFITHSAAMVYSDAALPGLLVNVISNGERNPTGKSPTAQQGFRILNPYDTNVGRKGQRGILLRVVRFAPHDGAKFMSPRFHRGKGKGYSGPSPPIKPKSNGQIPMAKTLRKERQYQINIPTAWS